MDIQRRIQTLLPRTLLGGFLFAAVPVLLLAQDKPRFYPDDPVAKPPKLHNATIVKARKTPALYDFLYNSLSKPPKTIPPAENVNTVGEVIDPSWYVNRHYFHRMSLDELRRGPGDAHPPKPPFQIVGAKLDGISPGFRMKDANGDLYFIKPDPRSAPEIATSADAVGARFFYALGYYTPENYIVNLERKDVSVSQQGTTIGANGRPRSMTERDIEKVLWKIPRTADGKYRFVASKAVPGEPLGPFRYEKTRSDDPNDVIAHENRRELRGLHVFCAWLNHTDAKAGNSQDTLIEENGVRQVRHYLIDFGAIFGSDSDMIKNAAFGNEYIIPTDKTPLKRMGALGLNPESWETAKTPKILGVGRFQAESFDPDKWVSNFPNRAFVHRLPDDEFWAARQVMAFTNEEIRAIVETGQYTNPKAVDYISNVLIDRRNKIGRTYYAKVLPLDRFEVRDNRLVFKDLAVDAGFMPGRQLEFAWSRYNNATNSHSAISGSGPAIPAEALSAPAGSYFAVKIQAPGAPSKTVTVYLRSTGSAMQVVGIDRTW